MGHDRDRYEGLRKLLDSHTTATDFTFTAGFKSTFAGSGFDYIPGGGGRGVVVYFVGTDANNETGSYELFAASPVDGQVPNTGANVTGGMAVKLGTGTFTLGSGTGIASGLISTSDFVADTVTWTVGAFDTAAIGAYGLGTITAFSPADNTPGCLMIPNVPACGLVLALNVETGASVNALYQRVRG